MRLAILAGGRGERLGLHDRPKPMVEIQGKPLLQLQVELAVENGITEIFFLTGYRSDVIFQHFTDGSRFGARITHIQDPLPLGTAGSIKLLQHLLEPRERLLVFYGDVALHVDLRRMQEFDNRWPQSSGSLLVHPNSHPFDSDLVEAAADGRITRFLPKPHAPGLVSRNLANAAVYILAADVLDHIDGSKSEDLCQDIFPHVLKGGKRLYAYRSTEYVKDIGVPARLESVRSDFQNGVAARRCLRNRQRAVFLDRDGVINPNFDPPLVEGFHVFESSAAALTRLNRSEFLTIVATNQPALAKGFITEAELHRTHAILETQLGREHAYLDDLYYCPHHPESGWPGEVPSLKRVCDCRKPAPGMLLSAAADWNIDLASSWMVGDSPADIQAGRAAGCHTVRIAGAKDASATFTEISLPAAVDRILSEEAGRT